MNKVMILKFKKKFKFMNIIITLIFSSIQTSAKNLV